MLMANAASVSGEPGRVADGASSLSSPSESEDGLLSVFIEGSRCVRGAGGVNGVDCGSGVGVDGMLGAVGARWGSLKLKISLRTLAICSVGGGGSGGEAVSQQNRGSPLIGSGERKSESVI